MGTHSLESAEEGISLGMERKRMSKGHSRTGDRDGQVRAQKASELGRGTHRLETRGRVKLEHRQKVRNHGHSLPGGRRRRDKS